LFLTDKSLETIHPFKEEMAVKIMTHPDYEPEMFQKAVIEPDKKTQVRVILKGLSGKIQFLSGYAQSFLSSIHGLYLIDKSNQNGIRGFSVNKRVSDVHYYVHTACWYLFHRVW